MPPVRSIALAAVVVLGVGLGLSTVVELDTITDADRRVTAHLHDWALESGTVADAARAVTLIGDPITLAVAVAAVAASLFFRGRRELAWWLVLTTLAAATTESLLKIVVGRDRPSFDSALLDPTSNSFPSGHATNTTVVLGSITIALVVAATSRRAGVVPFAAVAAVVVSIAVGLTRPVLGVHFVSDIVVGWLLGVVWLAIVRPWHRTDDVDNGDDGVSSDEHVTRRRVPPSG